MRTTVSFIAPLFTRALAAALLLTTACDQGNDDIADDASSQEELQVEAEPTEAETLRFSKELVISDGDNEVRLLIASEDESLLAAYDSDTFEIAPVFDRPERTIQSGDEADDAIDPPHEFTHAVLIEEQSAELEEGAIGYKLVQKGSGFRNGIQDCGSPNIYTSSRNFASVTVNSGSSCAEARISTRKFSWSWYTEKGHATLCSGMNLSAGKSNTNRVKLEVCPGPSYSHYFYN